MIPHHLRILAGVLISGLSSPVSADASQYRQVIGSHVHEGIEVELAIEPIGHETPLHLCANETVRFLFSIRDTTTSKPVTGLFPAAWVQTRPNSVSTKPNFRKMVEAFVSGGLFAQPEIDLNVYHVLSLNEDSSISVVDPLFGFGGSKLLTKIALPGPSQDWAMMSRASKLFVSIPSTNQIALIDTSSWNISTLMPQVQEPTQLFLQPDEHFLWASTPGGIAVFNTAPFSLQHLLPTGEGEHDIAFSPDNKFAFVANSGSNTVSVIDLVDFTITKTISTESAPNTIVYGEKADAVYLTHSHLGTISCIEGVQHEIYKTVTSEPGISQLKFAPNERWGFLVNPESNQLSIFDSSLDRIVQTGMIKEGPSEITFSDNFAYIRHLGSPTLILVPLDSPQLGQQGEPIPVVEVPAGDSSYGNRLNSTTAETLVQAPGANAMLIANPVDQAIYFYKEGMATPMGQFNNYGTQPMAVLVVDRSLREKSRSGTYETIAKLQRAGTADVAFFMDSPRLTLGFEFEVGEAVTSTSSPSHTTLSISSVDSEKTQKLIVGETNKLQFKMAPEGLKHPPKILAHTFLTGKSWRHRQTIEPDPDGYFSITIKPLLKGIYQTHFESTTPGFEIQQSKSFIFEAVSNSKN